MVSLLQRFSSNRSLLQSNANSESAKSLVHKKDKKSQKVSSHNSNENENSNPMKQKGSAADLKKGKNADVQEPTRAVEPSREELLGLLQKHTATLAHHQERFDNLKMEVAKMQHELTTADLHEKGEEDVTLEKLRAERWRAQKLLVQNKVAVAERLRDHEKRLRRWLLEEGKLKDALIAIQCMIERPLRLDESLRGKTVAGTDLRQILPSYIAPADPKLHMKHPLLDTVNSMDTDPLMSSDSDKQDENFLSLWASMTNLNSSDIQRADAPPELDAMRYVRSVAVAREALHARLTKRHAELEVEDRQLTERMQTLRKEALETINENRNQRIQKEEELLRTHSRECLKLTKQKQYLKQVTQERKFHMTRGMMQRKASSMSISPTRRSSPGRGRGSSGDYLPPFYRGNSETVDMMALESLIEDEKYRQSVTREQFEKLLEQKRAALDEESMLVGTLQKQKRELQSCLDELQRIATQGGVLSPVLEKNQMTPHLFRKNHANSRKPQNGGRGVNHVPHHGNSRSTTTSTVPTSFRGTAASKNSISLPGTAASVSTKQSSRAGGQKVQPGIAIATRTTTPGSCADSREMTKVITSSSSSTPIVRQTNRAGDGHIESNEKPIGRAPSVHQTVEVSSVNAIQQLPSPTSTTSDRREVSSAHEPPLPHKIDLANVQKEDSSYFPVDMDFPMMSPAASFLRSFYGARPQESQSNHPQSPTKGVAQSETETDSNFVEHPPPQTRMPDDITHTLSNNSVQCEGKKITGQEQDSALIHLCNLSLQSSTKVPTALMSDTVATNNDITTDASVTSLVFAEHPKFPTDQTDHSANKVNSDSSQIVQRTISAGLVSSDTICSQESEVNFTTFVGNDTNQTPKMNSSFRILGAGSTPSPEKLSTKTSSQERKQKSKSRHTSSSDRIHEKHPIALPLRSKKGF